MSDVGPLLQMLPVFALAWGVAIAAAEHPGWEFNSRGAQAAKRKYEEAAAKAEQDCARRLTAAREAAVKELGEAMRSATRAGDLDEANRIKAAIAELNEDATSAGGGRSPVGHWDVRYSNGVNREYEIRADGTVAWSDGARPHQGRLQRIEGGWLFPEDGDGNAERLAVTGDRLYVEHFHPASRYPKEPTRILAVGTRSSRKPQ